MTTMIGVAKDTSHKGNAFDLYRMTYTGLRFSQVPESLCSQNFDQENYLSFAKHIHRRRIKEEHINLINLNYFFNFFIYAETRIQPFQ